MSDALSLPQRNSALPPSRIHRRGTWTLLGLSVLSTLGCPCLAVLLLVNTIQLIIFRRWPNRHLAQLELAGPRVRNPTTLRSGRLKSLDWPVCFAVELVHRKSLPVPPHSSTAFMHHYSLSCECQKSAEGVKRCSTWGVVSRASIDSASSGSCSPGLPPLPLHSVKRCHISRPRRKSQ